MRKPYQFVALVTLASAAMLLSAFAGGCGSSSSGGGGAAATGFGCSETSGGNGICIVFTNLTPSEQTQATNQCMQQMGTVVTSCPTAGLSGCCKIAPMGSAIAESQCYYGDAGASVGMQICMAAMGTWTNGM
jgi:hypothetical protein